MTEDQLRAELDAVYASTSWRITAPFRWFIQYLKKVMRFLFSPARVRLRVKKIFGILLRKIFKQPLLRRSCMAVLAQFPKVRDKLKKIVLISELNQSQLENIKKMQAQQSQSKFDEQISDWQLTSEARQVLREFQSLVKNK